MTIGPPPPAPVLPPLPVCLATAQNSWKSGLLAIGNEAATGGDAVAETRKFLESHYAFSSGPIIFKPMNGHARFKYASRPESAIRYFNNPLLQFVGDIRLENETIVAKGEHMFVQGRCVFVLANDMTKVVDYTFGYEVDSSQSMRIFLHHSCEVEQTSEDEVESHIGDDPEQDGAEEIAAAQQAWSDGLMEIAAAAAAGADCEAHAQKFVDRFYSFDKGPILFKTLAPANGEVYFATSRDHVVKYFGNPVLQALTGIRFENICSITKGEHLFVWGNYHFTTAMGYVAQGEYVFGYEHDGSGGLSIFLQHSS